MSEEDSRVKAAVEAWAACMGKSGYSYTSVWEPNNEDWPEPPGSAEIATATADVTCKREVQLVEIWHAVDVAYQQRLIDRHQQELAAVKEYVEAEVRNAAKVLAES